jgi:hypothetical protein
MTTIACTIPAPEGTVPAMTVKTACTPQRTLNDPSAISSQAREEALLVPHRRPVTGANTVLH